MKVLDATMLIVYCFVVCGESECNEDPEKVNAVERKRMGNLAV